MYIREILEVSSIAAEVIIGLCLVVVVVKQFLLEKRNSDEKKLQNKEKPARDALEKLFSAELAEVRYKLFDHIIRAHMAHADGCDSAANHNSTYRKFFHFDKNENLRLRYKLWPRYKLVKEWFGISEHLPAPKQNILDDFSRLSGIWCSTIDSLLKAAEDSPESARLIQAKAGRLLVWWMLVWPGAFDHTGKFLAKKFVRDGNIAEYSPDDKGCDAYTSLFRKAPLWSFADWKGALENYSSEVESLFPNADSSTAG